MLSRKALVYLDHARGLRRGLQLLQHIEQAARIAIGIADDALARNIVELQTLQGNLPRMVEQGAQLLLRQGMQHVHLRARQQRAVHLERGVFGGGADEGDQTLFDERQERILLRLVEAVHFVHEQDGVTAALLQHELRLRNGFADILHAGQHRGQRHELGVEGRRHQARQCGLAHARRPPQDHRMQLAGFEGQTQRPARPQQMRLADDLVYVPGAQPLGQRGGGGGGIEQVILCGAHRQCGITHRPAHPRPWAAQI